MDSSAPQIAVYIRAGMAILHNNAGQYCKSEATKRLRMVFYSVSGICMAIAFGSAVMMCNVRNPWMLLGTPIIVLTLWLGTRRIDKWTDRLAKERIKYMRGGQAEALVAWLIQDDLDGWHLFNNVELIPGSDHDHVLVGPGGVWCLSTKSLRGIFTRQRDGLIFYNNRPTGLIQDTRERAMELRRRLDALLGRDVPFVEAVLAVPFAYVDFKNPQRNIWVLHQEDLVATIEAQPKRLSQEQIDRCVRALTGLAENARETYKRPAPAKRTA